MLQAASGRRTHIGVFGTDYDTPDGTCIRDYIHVQDLVEAHLLALDWLLQGKASTAFNLGNGHGFSIREVIHAVETVTGQRVTVQDLPRRAGDPAILVADSTRARAALGWAGNRNTPICTTSCGMRGCGSANDSNPPCSLWMGLKLKNHSSLRLLNKGQMPI